MAANRTLVGSAAKRSRRGPQRTTEKKSDRKAQTFSSQLQTAAEQIIQEIAETFENGARDMVDIVKSLLSNAVTRIPGVGFPESANRI